MKEFSDLEPDEKLEAMLASLKVPMTREFLLHAASVDLSQLNDATRTRIEKLLNNCQGSESDAADFGRMFQTSPREPVYRVSADQQSAVLERLGVDERSVILHFAEVGKTVLDQFD